MARTLPPLNALRAFETAGRHLNFTKAARELGVTPAAISQQINNLEAHLNVRLFERSSRGLRLTKAGITCLFGLTEGFDRLATTIERAKGESARTLVSVNTMQCFASMWLVPRMHRLQERCPDIDLRVAAVQQAKGSMLKADVTIRYRSGPYPGCHVERLMVEEVYPVCSPALLGHKDSRLLPAELSRFRLIHDESLDVMEGFPNWQAWLDGAGAPNVDPHRGARLNLTSCVINEAVAGRGFALGRSVLVADLIENGRLVRPFDYTYPVKFPYYVVWPRNVVTQHRIRALVEWLFEEADSVGLEKVTADTRILPARPGTPQPPSAPYTRRPTQRNAAPSSPTEP